MSHAAPQKPRSSGCCANAPWNYADPHQHQWPDHAAGSARISVLDHGLLFGDSVYETLRTYDGKPFLFSRHFARLEHSARAIDLKLPWSQVKTLEEITKTLMEGECRIRIVVTRGVGELEADIETCTDPHDDYHRRAADSFARADLPARRGCHDFIGSPKRALCGHQDRQPHSPGSGAARSQKESCF